MVFEKLHLQIYASQFMTSQIIPNPFVFLYLESAERKKLQKFEDLENEKSFLDETENTFHRFSRAIIW